MPAADHGCNCTAGGPFVHPLIISAAICPQEQIRHPDSTELFDIVPLDHQPAREPLDRERSPFCRQKKRWIPNLIIAD